MTVPIATSPARSGFGPELSLNYDSGAGNGPFGFGWSLSLQSITRKTDKGLPKYADGEESDGFILSGAEDLVPVFEKDVAGEWLLENGRHVIHEKPRTVDSVTYLVRRYRPRIEGLFARVERWSNREDPTDVFWRSISKENVTTWYGKTPESRIADPENPWRIFSWLICQSYDDKGNAIVYKYAEEDDGNVDRSQANERNRVRTANRYLKRIKYGNRTPNRHTATWQVIDPAGLPEETTWMFEVVFDYEEGHYEEIPLDPALAEVKQHRFVQTSAIEGWPWPVRPDPFSSYRAGFEVRTYRLCQRVLMFHHIPDPSTGEKGYDGLVRSTDFAYLYERDPTHAKKPVYSRLVAVTQSGYKRQEDGSYLRKSLPPLEFEYSDPVLHDVVEEVTAESLENLPVGLDGAAYQWTDLHGEGIPGILTEQSGAWFYKRNLSPVPIHQNGDGNGSVSLKARFAPVELVALKPNASMASGAQFVDLAGDGQPDLVVMEGAVSGLYEHDQKEGWEPFRPFSSRLICDTRDPNVKFVDLDGDGHADVLITEDDAFVWHPSLAEEGFGPSSRVAQWRDEEKGPHLVFADGTQSIYLADMSGDGLTDLVRIRNGEVCYWPNRGYGHFGAKITMDHAPHFDNPDQFDQKRIRLADIDGTGTNDIVYLHRDGVRLYFNQSGNSWSEPRTLSLFPRVDDLVSIIPTDLLGNGTACLVWSSPLPGDIRRPMRYVNLMGDHKPHLLIKTANNLGAETRVEYAPSTKFYLQDKLAGKPWATRLPLPVHVVEKVTTYDHISRNRFVTRYAYHHGYFNGEEREFRGFGMVEQWDTEQFTSLAPIREERGDEGAANNAAASHVPPVHTKTWFHTGVYDEVEEVSQHFAAEYYDAPKKSDPGYDAAFDIFFRTLLPDTVIPPNLTLEEEREACRALKGSMLRQEVYADDTDRPDATPEQIHRARTPYTVTEQNFTIRALQPRGANRNAVFFTHAREALSYHYERNPADPRIQHALTLEVDEFGNVLKQLAVNYGRQQPDASLPTDDDRDKQALVHITYTENAVTNAIADLADDHLTPLPAESRTYELRKPRQERSAGSSMRLYRFNDLLGNVAQAADGNHDIAYEDIDFARAQKAVAANAAESDRYFRRLIEQVRILYRPDDCGAAQNDPLALLDPRKLEKLALPGESYKLVFTPGLLDQVFKRPRQGQPDEPLLPQAGRGTILVGQSGSQGGYVDLDGNGHWWIPSGRSFYHPDDVAASVELAAARAHFFLPRRYRDPFGRDAFVDFDGHDLLMAETRDALGNRVTVDAKDYRVLQPRLVSDPNRNQTEVAFDTLGMVVGTAVMGKPLPASVEGDKLADFVTDLTQAQLDGFFDARNPHTTAPALLKEATTRIVYDLDRFWRTQEANLADPTKWQPTCAATLARETHASEPAPRGGLRIQASFSYSDGFGREIQKKTQAEPETPGCPLRWVGSGWTIFNNKGKPVRQYEPFFSDLPPDYRHRFEFGKKIGVSPVLFYDPLERVVATLHPNHTWEKVVFDPWRQETWDVNDTLVKVDSATGEVTEFDQETDVVVGGFFGRLPFADYLPTWDSLRTDAAHAAAFIARYPDATDRTNETRAAEKTRVHAATPTIAHADSLGRTFLTVAHNKARYSDPARPPVEEFHSTRIILDIEGNQREVTDAKDRVVMRYDYDMLGNRVHQASMEAGERWMLNDVAGKPLYAWDSRNHRFRTAYDALRRPTDSFLSEGGGAEMVVGRSIYGESRPNPEDNNLRGRVVELRDQAGIVASEPYDFKGNLLRSERQLADLVGTAGSQTPAYKTTIGWNGAVQLAAETYTSRTRYDALNRPTQLIAPHAAGAKVNVIQPGYNEANLLERIDVWLERAAEPASLLDPDDDAPSPVGVADIHYDAKGQRTLIDCKTKGATVIRTTYAYDRETFRLTHVYTRRGVDPKTAKEVAFTDDCDNPNLPPTDTIAAPAEPPAGKGCGLQNLHYTYDPAGSITHIRDDAQQTIYFKNRRVEPNADYSYDAIYRLIEATGREHLGQIGGTPIPHSYNDERRAGIQSSPFDGRFHPHDGNAMGRYCECYEYDAVGNIMEMIHRDACPGAVSWRRSYTYNETSQLESGKHSNRLTSTTVAGTTETYSTGGVGYDAHGNMLRMPHLQVMQWDFKNQLKMTQRQKVNNEDADGTAHHGERTWYVYDSTGQRVRKVTEQVAGGVNDERIYLGGFEIYRKNGATPLVRETLHIMDNKLRIALVETRTLPDTPDPRDSLQLIRYQSGNHLGSATLELDDEAQIISYEEYTPYGNTSYQAVRSQTERPKRYRFTGKERDEESGLYLPRGAALCGVVGKVGKCRSRPYS
ncbi:MAG: SpvB/TcaC N-terminal domain-containing protein [Verrucomicrobiia bacterium]